MEYVISAIQLPFCQMGNFFSVCRVFAGHLYDHFIPHHRNNYHPHILGHKVLGLFSVLLIVVKIFTLSLLSLGPILPAFSSAITSENIISLTNESRKTFSLPVLGESNVLDKAAQAKADDMLAKGYFAHTSPDGRVPWDFIQAAGYNYLSAGENLAVNFVEAENVETAWMNSPTHKANILNKNFEEIGIGISQGQYQGHNAIFVVQMFGTPAEQQVKITEKPTPVLTEEVPRPVSNPAQSQPKPIVAQAETQTLETQANFAAPLEFKDYKLTEEAGYLKITAQVLGGPVKVIANYNPGAVMLEPKTEGTWVGEIPLDKLATSDAHLLLIAYDLRGNTKNVQLANFNSSIVNNFNVLGTSTAESKVSFLGQVFSTKAFEQKFYLWFAVLILFSMVLAIGIQRRVQHLALITNSSLVVILAMLLWMAG